MEASHDFSLLAEFDLSQILSELMTSISCPICGGAAEAGCLYAGGSASGMHWMHGPSGLKSRLLSAMGDGLSIGYSGLIGKGTYLEGVYCKKCNKMTLEAFQYPPEQAVAMNDDKPSN